VAGAAMSASAPSGVSRQKKERPARDGASLPSNIARAFPSSDQKKAGTERGRSGAGPSSSLRGGERLRANAVPINKICSTGLTTNLGARIGIADLPTVSGGRLRRLIRAS
jgi:hypothetical protein